MLNKVLVLTLAGALTLGAKLWVNAVRDPGAELGQGDWKTDVWEWPVSSGVSDSAVISDHDSTRAFAGKFSFRTDTEKDPGIQGAICDVWCIHFLKIPKAIKDIDSCRWYVYVETAIPSDMYRFDITFHAQGNREVIFYSGNGSLEIRNDTLYSLAFALPNSKTWSFYGQNLSEVWLEWVNWSEEDTISYVRLRSKGWEDAWWGGQDVSWDNIYLASVAYYDYAAKSMDSDSLADESYTPQVTFANEGIKADKDAWVYAEIVEGSTRVYIDSQQVSIPKESSQQITFKTWTVPHTGPYTLRAYPILELDELSTDDTLSKTLYGSGITETPSPSLLQLEVARNTPFSFLVSYSIPNSEKGIISLYDPTGRRIESLRVKDEGKVSFKSKLTAGVYFVRLETGKTSITKKAVSLH